MFLILILAVLFLGGALYFLLQRKAPVPKPEPPKEEAEPVKKPLETKPQLAAGMSYK